MWEACLRLLPSAQSPIVPQSFQYPVPTSQYPLFNTPTIVPADSNLGFFTCCHNRHLFLSFVIMIIDQWDRNRATFYVLSHLKISWKSNDMYLSLATSYDWSTCGNDLARTTVETCWWFGQLETSRGWSHWKNLCENSPSYLISTRSGGWTYQDVPSPLRLVFQH